MSRNLRYHYTVKVLTPLHIGSGETIPDVAYHVSQSDSSSCFWTLLDLDAAAVEWSRRSGSTDFNVDTVAEFARKHRGPYRKYTLQVSPTVAGFLRQTGSQRPRIQEQIKLDGKPYLPGSSLKGAIRTALIGEMLLQGKKAEFEEAIRASLAKEDVSKAHLSDKAEETVLGDQHHDPLRGLRIGDSNEVSPREYLTISDVRVMGFDADSLEVVWKRFGIFLETLHPEPETLLTGELSFSTFLLEDPEVKKHLDFEGKTDLLLPDQLPALCQKKYLLLLQQELGLYKALKTTSNRQLTKVVGTLTNIQQQSETFGKNEFLLQLSWGTGWRAKTVGDHIGEKLLRQINREKQNWFQPQKDYAIADGRFFSSEHGKFTSPKTRRLVMDGDTPAWPLGWVKVSLEKLPEH
jgi:CRISPR-associated protein Csm5